VSIVSPNHKTGEEWSSVKRISVLARFSRLVVYNAFMWKNVLLVLMLTGCHSAPVYKLPGLTIPLKKGQKKLTKEQRKKAEKELKANKRLLEILATIEKDIKKKKGTADFFDFALSEDDEITLQAADLLLKYITKTKIEIDLKIRELRKKLGEAINEKE
jgi:hypothetical protein